MDWNTSISIMKSSMSTRKSRLLFFPTFLLIAQLACSLPARFGTPDTVATLNGLYTASVLTLVAQAGSTATPGLPPPTCTASLLPAVSTNTPVPYIRCDAATFINDVTYPDGTVVSRGASFIKTWRLKNIGTCAWTPSYALVFVGGDAMGGPSAMSLPARVNPGQTIDLSVTLHAPKTDGKYRGFWKFRNTSNFLFSIGAQADTAFWVDIVVRGPSYTAYNFVANYCQADWQNNNIALPCPGNEGDSKGYVIKLNHPDLENGNPQDEPGLLTVPKATWNGLIKGQYPTFKVKSGDRFRAQVYCRNHADNCDVTFRLDILNNGQIKNLGSWHEVNEGQFYPVDVNLNSLTGETLKFILVVSANGSSKDDEAIWLNPNILRQGSPPPTSTPKPTSTFTATFTPTFTPTATPTFTPTITPTP
jgi:hypothetical protein